MNATRSKPSGPRARPKQTRLRSKSRTPTPTWSMTRGRSPTELLEVALDGLGVAHVRRARVLAHLAQGAALAQQVPAAIQLDLDSLQPTPILTKGLIRVLMGLLLLSQLLLFG